jgi:hypothetical protein
LWDLLVDPSLSLRMTTFSEIISFPEFFNAIAMEGEGEEVTKTPLFKYYYSLIVDQI